MTEYPTLPVIKIYMKDARALKVCSSGSRDMFKRHNLDWSDFLTNGIDSDKLEATGEVVAINVVRNARNGR